MSTLRTKKVRGLYTAANRFDVPEGALVQANNITIRRDGVIQPRWGLDKVVSTFAAGGVTYFHRLENFKDYLMAVGQTGGTYSIASSPISGLGTPTILGTFGNAPSGGSAYSTTATPFYDVEMLKTNGCLYYNGDGGLIRIQDPTNTVIALSAGGSACAVSSAPRPISTSLARSGTTTVTATTAFANGYVVGLVVKMTSAGNAHFTAGEYTIVSIISATQFTYVDTTDTSTNTLAAQTFAANKYVGSSGIFATNDSVAYRAVLVSYDANGTEYVGEVSARLEMTNASPAIGASNLRNSQVAILFRAFDQVPANTKVQLYRTKIINAGTPAAEFYKVYEKFLTEGERLQGYSWVLPDATPDTVTGESLYVSPSQEGEDHNNSRPGGCFTTALWGDMFVQGNTLDYPTVEMQLLSTDSTAGGLSTSCELTFQNAAGTTFFPVNSGTAMTDGRQFTRYSGGTPSVDVKNTVLSLIDTINWCPANAPLNTFLAQFTSIAGDWPGRFSVSNVLPDTIGPTSPTALTRTVTTTPEAQADTGVPRTPWAPQPGVLQDVTATGVTRTTNVSVATVQGVGSPGFQIGEYVVVYSSWANQTVLTIGGTPVQGVVTAVGVGAPGTITFTNAGSNGTGGTSGATIASRTLPTFQSGWAPNRIKLSRHKSVEAFPAFTTLDIGQANNKILKMVPCGTSLMVFKEDGLFRVIDTGGDNEPVPAAQLVDATCVLWAKDSAIIIHNQIMAWTTKGIAIINEQGVQKYVSEAIYDLLQPQVFQTLPFTQRAFATAIPTDDAYELRIPFGASPSAPFASTLNLTYNTFTDTWVTDDLAVIGETVYKGARYITQGDGALYRETTTAHGISGVGSASGPGTTIAPNTPITNLGNGVFSLPYTGTAPSVGSKFNLSEISFGDFTCYSISTGSSVLTFYEPAGDLTIVPASNTLVINSFTLPVISTVEWAPITFTDEGQTKFFREASVFFGLCELPLARVSFATDLVPTAETATTLPFRLGQQLKAGTNNVFTSAPVALRDFIPRQHRRGQMLRVVVTLTCAQTPWTVLGLALTGDSISPRLAK